MRVVLGFGLIVLCAGLAQADDKPVCKLPVTGNGLVQSIVDGRTLKLADGREVRLAGIEAPENAGKTLENLVSGREITLMRLGAETDRYGRVVALVAVKPGAAEQSVQSTLLALGQARVSANIGDKACINALLGAEQAARAAGWPLGGPVLCDAKCRESGGDSRSSGSFRRG